MVVLFRWTMRVVACWHTGKTRHPVHFRVCVCVCVVRSTQHVGASSLYPPAPVNKADRPAVPCCTPSCPTCICILNLVFIHIRFNALGSLVHGKRHLACSTQTSTYVEHPTHTSWQRRPYESRGSTWSASLQELASYLPVNQHNILLHLQACPQHSEAQWCAGVGVVAADAL